MNPTTTNAMEKSRPVGTYMQQVYSELLGFGGGQFDLSGAGRYLK
jgi:hypothetical protein